MSYIIVHMGDINSALYNLIKRPFGNFSVFVSYFSSNSFICKSGVHKPKTQSHLSVRAVYTNLKHSHIDL